MVITAQQNFWTDELHFGNFFESQWKHSDLALAEKFLNYRTRMQWHHNTEHSNHWLQTDRGNQAYR